MSNEHLEALIGLTEEQARLVLQVAHGADRGEVAFVRLGFNVGVSDYVAAVAKYPNFEGYVCYLDKKHQVCLVTHDHNGDRGVVCGFDSYVA